MRRSILSFLFALICASAFTQSVPFPEGPINNSALENWGYQQVGTTWDTSPFLPFIYNSRWLRLMPPNGVTYTASTKTWNYSSPGTKYPLILFFHGLGERGTDNNNQLKHGGQRHRDAVLSGQFPGFLVYPQSTSTSEAKALIEKLITILPIDINRIYVHGLSGGGGQAWEFAINYHTLTAAAFPMSATSDEARDAKMLYTPLRQSQGGLDANPTPAWSQITVDWFNTNGGHLEYFYLPTVGHGTWNTMYNRSDFFTWFLSQKKNKIMVRYDRTENCPGDAVVVDMGFTPGFEGYEWRKDGVLIAGQNSHKLLPTSHGTYTGRILNRGVWSDWSDPVVVKEKAPTQTPNIQLATLQSYVIPDVNNNSNVTLTQPAGYETYTWTKVGTAGTIGTTQSIVVNEPGQYQAVVKEFGGCSSIPSPAFSVINAPGSPKPDPISNLKVTPISRTQLKISWDNVATPVTNEIGFEIFRAEAEEGPYQLVAVNPADVVVYNNTNLESSQRYWYIVRPFAATGAAAASAPVSGITEEDVTPPTAPYNLTATTNSNVSVSLSWAASTDDVGVEAYDVYVRKYGQANYIKAYSTTALSQVVYGLESNTLYNFIIKARDETGNVSAPSNLAVAPTYLKGLNYSYYQGDWTTLPNFSALTPISTGVINRFLITPRNQNDYFGFVYTGTLEILTAGNYTFYLESDDGSKLWVNNQLVVDNNGLHGTTKKTGLTVYLNVGYYPIRAEYFERTGGGEALRVKYSGPGITEREIPEERLREGFTMPTAPATPAKPTLVVQSYKSIQVNWTAYTGTGTEIEVLRSTVNNNTASNWRIAGTVPANQTSFVDDKLNASTTYYYRLRAINSGNISAWSATTGATTQALPPLPTAPGSLSVQNVALASIGLSWADNSNNEDNFEVYRSVGNNSGYEKLATLGANSTTYTDIDLLPHTLYYYRVVSKNVTGNSANSNEVSATTLNSTPSIAVVTDKSLRYDEQLFINLSASDADYDFIVFGAPSLPSFAQLFDYGDGTAILQLTPTIADLGTVQAEISIADAFGGLSTRTFNINVNSNHSPVIAVTGTLPIAVKESYLGTVQLTATDADNDAITWSLVNAPAFVSTQISGNTLTLNALPSLDHAGTYQVTVVATDVNGATTEQGVTINVSDYDPNYGLLVNFTKSNITGYGGFAPSPWTNIGTHLTGGATITFPYTSGQLTRNDGVPNSGVTITLAQSWIGADIGGMTTGGLIYPVSVSQSYLYHSSATAQTIVINGLNPIGKYNLKLFSSRSEAGRSTIFTVNGVSVPIATSMNASVTADFNSITPASDGKITISVARGSGSSSAIVNSLVIEAYFDGNTLPPPPTNLQASLDANNDVQLTWTDVASNESGYQVFRSTDNINFSKIADVGIDVSSYLDASVVFGNTYYFKVRAINAIGNSDYSNTVSLAPANSAPVVAPIPQIVIPEGGYKVVVVTATDPEGQAVTFSLENEPYFIWTEYAGANKVNLVVEPDSGTKGTYTFNLHAQDAAGAITTLAVTVEITDENEKEYRVNFTTGSSLAAAPWNNFTNSAAGQVLANLKDNVNTAGTISLTLQDAWGGVNNLGYTSGNNTGIYPDVVTSTYFWFAGPGTRTINMAGLNPARKYDFTFYGSRTGDGTRNVTFAIAGKVTGQLDVLGNQSSVVSLTNISPAANGQLTLTVTAVNDMAHLNALVIREYVDNGVPPIPAAPSSLSALVYTKTTANLKWSDLSDNESGFEVWRSVGDNLNYVLVTTTGADATAYTATGIVSGTTYYYKVRAKNASGNSAFTNEVSFVGYNYALPINFNASSSTQVSGWNNLTQTMLDLSVADRVTTGLKDESGVNTGISLKVITPFEAPRTNGATTGNNSGILPDAVMLTNYYIEPASSAVLRFEGLSLLNKYNFSFFGSRANADGINRITDYTVNGVTVTLNALGNTSTMVQIRDVEPDDFGTITITVSARSGNASFYGYLNAMFLQAVNNPNGGARVAALAQRNSTLGVEEEVRAYPNPFVSTLNLELVDAMSDDFDLSILNAAGVEVFYKSYGTKPTGALELDLADLPGGVYILRIKDSNGYTVNRRLVKK